MKRVEGSNIRIRRGEATDRDVVLALVPGLHEFGPPPWRDVSRMLAVDRAVLTDAIEGRSPGALVLVAEDAGGVLLGFIHVCEEEDYYGGPCGHIGDIVVAAESRGCGVGSALMAAAERWARERGYALLTLNVFLGNVGARALYEELGFKAETARHVKILDESAER